MVTGQQKNIKKKNIGFVIGHLSHGGAEKQLFILCSNLDTRLYRPIVFCLSDDVEPWGKRLRDSNIQLIVIPRLFRFDLIRIIRLRFFFSHYKIDIIISYLHIGTFYTFWAKLFCLRKIRWIVQMRSRESRRGWFFNIINRYILRCSDLIVANSEQVKDFLINHFNQRSEYIKVIYNALEIKENKVNKKESSNTPINIGTIGKDTWDKNIDLFIHAGIELLNCNKKVCFHLCGRGLGVNNRFLKSIPGKFQPYFIFYGELDDPDLIYRKLDIYLSTSNSEGLPNTVMEAMAWNIPVIATDAGGTRELIQHKKTGFLTPVNNQDAIIKYCQILINNKILCKEIGNSGRILIKNNFSIEKMVHKTQDILS